ncbi:MAG: hypothetical protein NZ580_04275 [Bacteroidia bacterium]|nr:hypothetical protein [Bacteroidia bacterium]MDW8236080.1 hypothetical protein [Bacteroidia bacterium]
MKSILWCLPTEETTHYEAIGELYHLLLHRFSREDFIWSVSWNPQWSRSKPSYVLIVQNAQRRHIGFLGAWRPRRMRLLLENLWSEEGFVPESIYTFSLPWVQGWLPRWKRKYPLQWVETYPHSLPPYASEPSSPEPHTVSLYLHQDAAVLGAHLAELLALKTHTIFVLGTPQKVTPLRSAATRFPEQIKLYLGLPWIEEELYLMRSRVLISLGKPYGEEGIVRTGATWLCENTHPLAARAWRTFRSIEEVPFLLSELAAHPPLQSPVSPS